MNQNTQLPSYRTRKYHKDIWAHVDASFHEYAEASRDLLDTYVDKYCLDPNRISPYHEFEIRTWLNFQDRRIGEGKSPAPPKVQDYYIKCKLGIISRDLDFEKSTGFFEKKAMSRA